MATALSTGVHLGLQRLGQQPPGTFADDLIDQRRLATVQQTHDREHDGGPVRLEAIGQ